MLSSSTRSLIRSRHICGVAPSAANIAWISSTSSISACADSVPKMSTLICQCSRSRPRCGRSYRWQLTLQYHRAGKVSSFAWPAIILATDGVISGRSASRRPPRSVSV